MVEPVAVDEEGCYHDQDDRGEYRAKWRVSQSTITLSSAERIANTTLPPPLYPDGNAPGYVIEANYALMQTLFPPSFRDFDWKWLGEFGDLSNTLPQQRYIKSDTTLVAAMTWARLTTLTGLINPSFNMTAELQLGLRVYQNPGKYQKPTPTLQRSMLLAAVLAVNPVIILFTLIIRVLLFYDAPISKNFGFAALLAGIDEKSLSLVKGAAYSGKLKHDVRVAFSVFKESDLQSTRDSSDK